MTAGLLGCMTTPAQGNVIPEGAWWAADNGRFGKGWPGAEKWRNWLQDTGSRYGTDRCLWAVAPDTPMDAAATLTESTPWLAKIRALEMPAAFAAQDGSEAPGMIPWDELDVLFLGGSTEWKTGAGAAAVAAEALRRGKQVHMGRVNSSWRLWLADQYGCVTADGTYIAFGPDRNLPRVLQWLERLDRSRAQCILF